MLNLFNLIYILAIGIFRKLILFEPWNRISSLVLLLSCILSFNFYDYQENKIFYAQACCLLFSRFLSTNSADLPDSSVNNIIPIKFYGNADIQKQDILNENKGKAGIYRWTNILNRNTYVGSAIDLSQRLKRYYTYSYLTHKNNQNMLINKALLKYGYSNFSLEILEYCDNDVISREQYYLDTLKPEYNILKMAGSSLGYKHSKETREKMSETRKGENNPMHGKTPSLETINSIKNKLKGYKHSEITKFNMSRAKGTTIFAYSLQYELLYTFTSSQVASKHFKCSDGTIMKYARSNAIFKKEYKLSTRALEVSSKSA